MSEFFSEQQKVNARRVRLSNNAYDLQKKIAEKGNYQVVVVGSGYGGSIAAARLASKGFSVCLLERGREIRPGEYPCTELEGVANTQVDLSFAHFGSNTALYDFRLNKDIHALVGCGLGGTSLINANVALPADSKIFQTDWWPKKFHQRDPLSKDYEKARKILQPVPYPGNRLATKTEALRRSAKAFTKGEFSCPPLNITFQDRRNSVGIFQPACNDCGNCCSGCNVGAKNTTLMNYLPFAVQNGADIFAEANVRYISASKNEEQWIVHYTLQNGKRDEIIADYVILAAGTLGSTEILLRSQENGLKVSDWLGHRFTGNGDVLGVGYDTDAVVQGFGRTEASVSRSVFSGPTITGVIDLRKLAASFEESMIIEEGAIPLPLVRIVNWILPAASLVYGREPRHRMGRLGERPSRVLASLLFGPYNGASRNTQTYLVISHDEDGGRMFLKNDRLRIDWPHVGEDWDFTKINDNLYEATKKIGGVYLRNPIWSKDFGLQLITVHPLGGCVMADCAERGVVNHEGLVFREKTGANVHQGLYVCDGSTIPSSLGVNPLLTIAALAERFCRLFLTRAATRGLGS